MPTGAHSESGQAPTVESIERGVRELVALVEARLPERFYVRGEPAWRVGVTALLARMAGLADSVVRLIPARRPLDTAIVIRALYEYVVTTSWLLIDPTLRMHRWADAARREYTALHRDAARYGVEPLTDASPPRGATTAQSSSRASSPPPR